MKSKKIILIMGLPGSGKTTLARELAKKLKADWLNADQVRGKYKDWDFSNDGIIRQVKRMRRLAEASKKRFVVAVSGGPDSLALVALSKAYMYQKKTKFFMCL